MKKRSFPKVRLGVGLVVGAVGWLIARIPLTGASTIGWTMLAVGLALVVVPSLLWLRTRATSWAVLASVGIGLGAASLGWLGTRIPTPGVAKVAWWIVAAGLALAVVPSAVWIKRRTSTQAILDRWESHQERHGGTASWWEWLRTASRFAMLAKAHVYRPQTFDPLEWWQLAAWIGRLFFTDPREVAVRLAKDGRRWVWSSVEDVTLRVGGPRVGKTAELASHIVDHCGPAVVTSTRVDIALVTMAIRGRRGPVHFFNPTGVGGFASTIKWSPIMGCEIPETAMRRANAMIPQGASAEGERWDIHARRILAVLMHAAALENSGMVRVLEWVANPNDVAKGQVDLALEKSPHKGAWRKIAEQLFGTNMNTKTSITATITPALQWLQHSRAAEVASAAPSELFDVRAFLMEDGTAYLLGKKEASVAPLVSALTEDLAYQARLLAAERPGGRLDPPLAFFLDEAAIICPVPLDQWTADFGGWGMPLHISVQSRAQLNEVFGEEAGNVILDNVNTVLVFGGTKNERDLRNWSLLAGERVVETETKDADGKVTSRATKKEPVLSPDRIRKLGKFQVMVIRSGMNVCLARTPNVFARRDVRAANRATRYAERVETSYQAATARDAAEGWTPDDAEALA